MTTPPPLGGATGLSESGLTLAKERTYHVYVVIVSVLVWAALAISLIGLFYALLLGFFLWIGNGLLTAHLRSEAVRVTERQIPELHRTFQDVCSQLGVRNPPALYVLQAGGMLNAFATKHSGRDFVVIYSDFLEALGPASPEMRFVLGHELGHLKSRHIFKQIALAPGLFMPLLGPAYRRAWESSCDRFGAYAAGDVDGAVRAMLVISGGREHGRRLDAAAFADQHVSERGFFISLHELTSTYPTLSRRVSDLVALKGGTIPASRPRHPLAYFLALFIPGGGASASPAGGLIVIVMIGLLAAMAIPAFQKVRQSSQQVACLNNQRMLTAALDQYALTTGKPVENWADVVGPGKLLEAFPDCLAQGTYSAAKGETGYVVECSHHGTLAATSTP